MCTPSNDSLICRNDVGAIFRCRHCSCVNVCIRNIRIHLDQCGMMGFLELAEDLYDKHALGAEGRAVKVPTPYAGIDFYFTVPDILQIIALLRETELILTAENLINSISE